MEERTLSSPHLVFTLSGENYAIDVLKVREILEVVTMTPIPDAEPFMIGLINLRGSVIPVLSPAKLFALDEKPLGPDSCIVIVETHDGDGLGIAGLLVDAVQAVLHFDAAEISEPPRIGLKIRGSAVSAVAKKGEDFMVVLDVDRIFERRENPNVPHTPDTQAALQAHRGE